ncbi:hypothetical protein FJV82_11985 [Mesorhizobium sp. WSM4305]|nr:hypothetical protein FJV82_11985 [Mesorhizobium sp. WSM4305]
MADNDDCAHDPLRSVFGRQAWRECIGDEAARACSWRTMTGVGVTVDKRVFVKRSGVGTDGDTVHAMALRLPDEPLRASQNRDEAESGQEAKVASQPNTANNSRRHSRMPAPPAYPRFSITA